jgi:hypothetical protein
VNDPRANYTQVLLSEAREELGRADGKVSVLLATVGVAAGAIVASHWSPAHLVAWAQAIWWLGVAVTVAGILVLASALAPRTRHPDDNPEPLRYFGHAAKFGSPGELLSAISKVSDQMTHRAADQLWVVSRLVILKYARIRLALVAFAVGATLLIVAASGG